MFRSIIARRVVLFAAVLMLVGLAGLTPLARAQAPATNPALGPGFDRPLVIDRKLERDVAALAERLAALEAKVAALEKAQASKSEEGKKAQAKQ